MISTTQGFGVVPVHERRDAQVDEMLMALRLASGKVIRMDGDFDTDTFVHLFSFSFPKKQKSFQDRADFHLSYLLGIIIEIG